MGGGGATYDYGFRIYNPNLGRFLSIDPLSEDYPWYTPYQFAGNKPIEAIDLDGLEEYFVTEVLSGNLWRRTYTKNPDLKQRAKDVGTFQMVQNGKPVGAVMPLTEQNFNDLAIINGSGVDEKHKTGWEYSEIRASQPLIVKTNEKEVKQVKNKPVIEEKSKDKVEKQPLINSSSDSPAEKKQKEKQGDLTNLATVRCSRSLRGQTCGAEQEHFDSQVESFIDALTKGGPKAVLVLTWDGDGMGLVTDAKSWGEKGSNGGTLLTDAIRYHNRVVNAIVSRSDGKIKKDQVVFKLGDPNGSNINATISK